MFQFVKFSFKLEIYITNPNTHINAYQTIVGGGEGYKFKSPAQKAFRDMETDETMEEELYIHRIWACSKNKTKCTMVKRLTAFNCFTEQGVKYA